LFVKCHLKLHIDITLHYIYRPLQQHVAGLLLWTRQARDLYFTEAR